jgi:hypothetical protein
MYLVRSGTIALERTLTDGTALTLSVASVGMALAEASLFATTAIMPGAGGPTGWMRDWSYTLSHRWVHG